MKHFIPMVQNIFDELTNNWPDACWHSGHDFPVLGFSPYVKGGPVREGFVYLLMEDSLPEEASGQGLGAPPCAFLYSGSLTIPEDLYPSVVCITLDESVGFPAIFARVSEILDTYRRWEREVIDALDSKDPLDSIIESSIHVFHNPIFVHDSSFYILSCPERHPKMSIWEKDSRTGREICPIALINDFKADDEYLNTLTLHEAAIYSAWHRSYPILFYNLWNHERYEGRICIDELNSPLKPGQNHMLTWLGDFIIDAIRAHHILWLNVGNRIEYLLQTYLSGSEKDTSMLSRALYYLGWANNDRFLCMRLETDSHSIQPLSSASTIGHIESALLTGCFAFEFMNGIVVLADLTLSTLSAPELLSRLAIILREGLLKMGVSTIFSDFSHLNQAYYQARTVLELGMQSTDTRWYYRFDDYLMPFIVRQSTTYLSPELLVSNKLKILLDYDKENGTDFLETLKVYLRLERNVLQTAGHLYIHRSTLFYRLNRIAKICGINYEDPDERLTLLISFYILEMSETHKK